MAKKNKSKYLGIGITLLLILVVTFFILNSGTDLPISEETASELKVNSANQFNETVVESIAVLTNNPPKTREDYQNLLGKLDYSTTYELFYDKSLNDSAVNYSENPIEEVISLMDQLVYRTDKDNYGTSNYWASPSESLNLGRGDDEDFALLFYALFENFRDKNSTCYLIGNTEFTGIFCYTPKNEINYGKQVIVSYILEGYYFDNWGNNAGQMWRAAETISVEKEQTDQDIKISIRSFIKNFMMDQVGYCCYDSYQSKVTGTNKEKITFLYNRDNFLVLTDTTSFADFIFDIVK